MKNDLKPLKSILEKQYIRYIVYLTFFSIIASVITLLISLHFDRLKNCQSLSNRILYLNDVFAREIIIGSTDTFTFELKKLKNDYNLKNIELVKKPAAPNTSCSLFSMNSTIHQPVLFSNKVLGYIVSSQGSFELFKISDFALFVPLLVIVAFSLIFVTSLTKILQLNFFIPLTSILKDAEFVGLDKNSFNYDGNIEEFDTLTSQLNSMLFRINQMNETNLKLEKAAGIGEIATQVAHDIRSPLEVLKSLKVDLAFLPEESKRRIQMGINRIEEITFHLLRTHKEISGIKYYTKHDDLLSLLISVLTEKSIEYKNRTGLELIERFDSNSYGLFSKIQSSTLKNIISNLINNGIESFSGQSGTILVQLVSESNTNLITVSDSGLGIKLDVQNEIFSKGFTTKSMGNGLGVYNAKQELEAVQGTISFSSESGRGTTFYIRLPKSQRPAFFVESINTDDYERIIVLDDDPAFHEVWNKRLQGLEEKIEHIHSVEEMFSKYKALNPKILLLSDFELMDKELDGIDTILKLNHAAHSVLVTARNEEQAIQDRCLDNGIKLLSKSLVNYVKIISSKKEFPSEYESVQSAGEAYGIFIEGGQARVSNAKSSSNSPVVLIDDDRLIHLNWAAYCKKNSLTFHSFYSIDAFLVASSSLDKASRIYIDSNLGDGIKGEVESEKIYQLGFLNLYLATGYEKESILKPLWIKEVYSKSPEGIS